jgi:AcrR family transcriptional regulator
MPRITAATVPEHVAQQEAAVIAAARELFKTRGVREVTLADIAAEVGLRRTSLYRYFPTKAHILQRWFDLTMAPLIEASRVAVQQPGTTSERFDRWLDVQVTFLVDDEHASLLRASQQSDDLPEDVRQNMATQHRALYATLEPILLEPAGGDVALSRLRGQLIAGLVRTAGDLLHGGAKAPAVRAELSRSAHAVADLH